MESKAGLELAMQARLAVKASFSYSFPSAGFTGGSLLPQPPAHFLKGGGETLVGSHTASNGTLQPPRHFRAI